jgi:Integrase zinc binding domain
LRICHDNLATGGHLGFANTLETVRRQYSWPTLLKDIKAYIRDCDTCQRAKVARHRPYGLLTPLPLPLKPMSEFSIDFITELPPVLYKHDVVDMILVIVDRYTKYSFYFPLSKYTDAGQLAEL